MTDVLNRSAERAAQSADTADPTEPLVADENAAVKIPKNTRNRAYEISTKPSSPSSGRAKK